MVVIVTILGGVAMVGYHRYRSAARLSEATSMVSAIRAAQSEYRGEMGVYANVSSGTTAFYPSRSPGPFKTAWGAPCDTCTDPYAWERLKVHAPGPVMYGYSTIAGIGGIVVNLANPSDPFYVVTAHGDTDGDGVACDVVGNSESNQLVITNDSE